MRGLAYQKFLRTYTRAQNTRNSNQYYIITIITLSSRITKFVSGWSSDLGPCWQGSDSEVSWGWGQPSPLSTPRRLRCPVLGISPFSPPLKRSVFPFYEMTTGFMPDERDRQTSDSIFP